MVKIRCAEPRVASSTEASIRISTAPNAVRSIIFRVSRAVIRIYASCAVYQVNERERMRDIDCYYTKNLIYTQLEMVTFLFCVNCKKNWFLIQVLVFLEFVTVLLILKPNHRTITREDYEKQNRLLKSFVQMIKLILLLLTQDVIC